MRKEKSLINKVKTAIKFCGSKKELAELSFIKLDSEFGGGKKLAELSFIKLDSEFGGIRLTVTRKNEAYITTDIDTDFAHSDKFSVLVQPLAFLAILEYLKTNYITFKKNSDKIIITGNKVSFELLYIDVQ